MKNRFPLLALAVVSTSFAGALLPVRAADADNSANNRVDLNGSTMTPETQSNESADVAVTRDIRRAIIKDSSLSMYAHNIKIVTTNNHEVYLRGVVASQDEVHTINHLARQNAHHYAVKNELSVTK